MRDRNRHAVDGWRDRLTTTSLKQHDRADGEVEAAGQHDDRLTGGDDGDDRDLHEDVADVGGGGEHVGGDREHDEQGDGDEHRGEALEVARR